MRWICLEKWELDVGRLRNKIHSIIAHGMDRLVE